MGEENVNQEVEVPSNTVDEAVVHEAESQGWVSKEKYRGDEKDWVDADVFVKRGREILPILRKNNENLIKELNNTKEQLKEFKQAADEFKKFQKASYERKAEELQEEIVRLKVAKAQAITDGDGQKANAIDDAIDDAKDKVKDAKEAAREEAKTDISPPSSIDPTLQTWLDSNSWFGKDARLTAQTNALGEVLRKENPTLVGQAFLDKLDDEIQDLLKKKKAPAGRVESGSGTGRSSPNAKSYENLPDEAKRACNKFTKQGLMTKEQYVADYAWD
jgi:hypothetical protein